MQIREISNPRNFVTNERIVRRKLKREIARNYEERGTFISWRVDFSSRRPAATKMSERRRTRRIDDISHLELFQINYLVRCNVGHNALRLLAIPFFFGINPSRDAAWPLMSSLGEHKRPDDLWSETPRWRTVAKQRDVTQIRLRWSFNVSCVIYWRRWRRKMPYSRYVDIPKKKKYVVIVDVAVFYRGKALLFREWRYREAVYYL